MTFAALNRRAAPHNAYVQKTTRAGTKGVPRAQREQLILDAATDEFGRLGYAGAALASVAAAADVSKPLVLGYFGSKENLYIACVERAGQNLIERIERVLNSGAEPLQLASDTLTAIFSGLEPRPHDWTVIADRTAPQDSPADDAVRQVRATIAGQAARGVATLADVRTLDADDLSALTDIWMSSVTALVDWWLRHPQHSASDMASRARRILTAITGY